MYKIDLIGFTNIYFLLIRSISGGRFRGSLRHSNRTSSNGGSSSGTIGGGLSDCYFGTEEKVNSSIRKESSRKFEFLHFSSFTCFVLLVISENMLQEK